MYISILTVSCYAVLAEKGHRYGKTDMGIQAKAWTFLCYVPYRFTYFEDKKITLFRTTNS